MPKNVVTASQITNTEAEQPKHHTLYDDVFKTMCTYMLPLLIPVVNELFGTNYLMDKDELERFANEHMKLTDSEDVKPKVSKIISDALIKLGDVMYHIECQSTEDGNIMIRILDYNMQIALDNIHHDKNDNTITVQLPHSALIMLRKTSDNEPKKSTTTVSYVFEDRKLDIQVPVMHVQSYSMEEVFDKKLYFMIPFYILRYEKKLELIAKNPLANREEYDKIFSELNKLSQLINKACDDKEISEYYIREISILSKKVVNLVSGNLDTDMKERLVNTMDGQILELGFQQWYREGREEGQKAERINTLREKERADAEALRADAAVKELAQANSYIKDLEAQLAEKNNS